MHKNLRIQSEKLFFKNNSLWHCFGLLNLDFFDTRYPKFRLS